MIKNFWNLIKKCKYVAKKRLKCELSSFKFLLFWQKKANLKKNPLLPSAPSSFLISGADTLFHVLSSAKSVHNLSKQVCRYLQIFILHRLHHMQFIDSPLLQCNRPKQWPILTTQTTTDWCGTITCISTL